MPKESSIVEGVKALHQVGRNVVHGPFGGQNSFVYGRVVNIVLSIQDPLFTKYRALETIEFEPVHDVSINDESGNSERVYLSAYKYNANVRTPLINEIVPLITAPSLRVQDSNSQFSEMFYYLDPVSLYAAVEHNAAPDQNTINNIGNFNSSNNKVLSYQNANAGTSNNTSGTDTVKSDKSIVLGSYFKERGIKPLSPLEGDHKVEGRFGNSIRLGGSPSSNAGSSLAWKGKDPGSPVIIIRNNQKSVSGSIDSLFEDINEDGSSLYFLSDQTIDFELSSNNFDSYNQKNDNNAIKQIVSYTPRPVQSVTQSAHSIDRDIPPTDAVSYPVSASSLNAPVSASQNQDFIPENEDDLNFVQIGEDVPVPVTQGLILNAYNPNYKFVASVNMSSTSNTYAKAPTISLSSVNAINRFAGQVSSVPTITNNGKALLDLLALTEGTMGQGNFNGYDIIVRGGLVPGYTTATSMPQHPNIRVFISEYNIYSSATGRYQFIISTWNTLMGKGTVVSKFNQDYACWKNILNSANVPSTLIAKIDTDFDSFKQAINMMAAQWASLPVLNDPKGLYKQAGRFSFDTLYSYYKQILAKYK